MPAADWDLQKTHRVIDWLDITGRAQFYSRNPNTCKQQTITIKHGNTGRFPYFQLSTQEGRKDYRLHGLTIQLAILTAMLTRGHALKQGN